MSWVDTFLWVIFILSLTFSGVLLFAALLVFQRRNPDQDEPNTPIVSLLPFFDIIWGVICPVLHWRENSLGRNLCYWLMGCLVIAGASGAILLL